MERELAHMFALTERKRDEAREEQDRLYAAYLAAKKDYEDSAIRWSNLDALLTALNNLQQGIDGRNPL